MRKLLLWNLIVCALLGLPALAMRGDDKDALRERLSSTVNSLASFAAIGRRLEAKDAGAIEDLLAVSDAGTADVTQAEAELVVLRTRVNALREILDSRAEWATSVANASGVADARNTPNTGNAGAPLESALSSATTGDANAVPSNKKAFEAADFVVDRARLGRVCWRGGRYLEGVAALEALAGEPKADYWRARCLEKLSRNSEAIAVYRDVIRIGGDSPEARSAREDLEFLEWSLGHGLVGKQ